MRMHGWGRYPIADAVTLAPLHSRELVGWLTTDDNRSLIARGMGRSYGDSALAPLAIATTHLHHLLDFDAETGVLRCEAGVTLADLLTVFVPRGWFLAVTPGTRFVTIGGAIASDVHGKNHHRDGCFSEYVIQFTLLLASGDVITCSREQHADLFRATCGGMGLTGIILTATIRLRPIQSAWIDEITYKSANLAETLALFEQHRDSTYSVAWIDCLARGARMGRALVMLGEHAPSGELACRNKTLFTMPIDLPAALMNRWSISAFNALYYRRIRGRQQRRQVHLETFFYPLDNIGAWNRLYGKRGFVQYQFVIPKAAGIEAMRRILGRITASGRGSFLAVLKTFGPANENYLSFPQEGYTLALDFKLEETILELLDELDRLVLDYGGRIYLTKDARMSAASFKQSYPRWEAFQEVRQRYGALEKFQSQQSQRLGL